MPLKLDNLSFGNLDSEQRIERFGFFVVLPITGGESESQHFDSRRRRQEDFVFCWFVILSFERVCGRCWAGGEAVIIQSCFAAGTYKPTGCYCAIRSITPSRKMEVSEKTMMGIALRWIAYIGLLMVRDGASHTMLMGGRETCTSTANRKICSPHLLYDEYRSTFKDAGNHALLLCQAWLWCPMKQVVIELLPSARWQRNVRKLSRLIA